MFDLITLPTSPLRRRLVEIGFATMLPALPRSHSQEAQDYFARLGAEGASAAAPEHEAQIRIEAAQLLARDTLWNSIERLAKDQDCAVHVQDNLTYKLEELRRQTHDAQFEGLRLAARYNGQRFLSVYNLEVFAIVAIWSFAASYVLTHSPGLILLLVSLSPMLLVSGLWLMSQRRRRANQRNLQVRRDEGAARTAVLATSLAGADGLVAQEALQVFLDRQGSISEEEIGLALRANLAQCAQGEVLFDVHHFLRAAMTILDKTEADPEDRTVVLPLAATKRLLDDRCPESAIAFDRELSGGAALIDPAALEIGAYVGYLSALKAHLSVGSDGLVELSGTLAHEEDPTIFRLSLPRAAI